MKKILSFVLLVILTISSFSSGIAEGISEVFPADQYSIRFDEFDEYSLITPIKNRTYLMNCVNMSDELLRDNIPILTCSSSVVITQDNTGIYCLNFRLYSDVFHYGATKAKFLVDDTSYEFNLVSTENVKDHYDVTGIWISLYQIIVNTDETYYLIQDMFESMSKTEDLAFKVRLYSDNGNMDFSVPNEKDMFNYVTLGIGMSDAIEMWNKYSTSTYTILPFPPNN